MRLVGLNHREHTNDRPSTYLPLCQVQYSACVFSFFKKKMRRKTTHLATAVGLRQQTQNSKSQIE